jgi:N-acetylmuramic acid 6-phosphate (MurNAc-6-P) etherase
VETPVVVADQAAAAGVDQADLADVDQADLADVDQADLAESDVVVDLVATKKTPVSSSAS